MLSFQQMLKGVYKMKISGEKLEKSAEDALRACLSKVPFLKINNIRKEPGKGDKKPDLLVKLLLKDIKKDLLVEVKSNGQPRRAREAVNQLLRYQAVFPGAYGVFVAPYISPKASEICIKEGIGYADLSGNCRLCFEQVFIEQTGNPNAFAKKRDLRSLYSPKAERVLRVLLYKPEKTWRIIALADEAGVSLGQVANVKKLLNDREWIQTGRSGFSLIAPEKILNEWTENYTYRKSGIRNFYSLKSVPEIEANIAEICRKRKLNYALTGFSGAARLAPAVRYQRAFVYIDEAEEDVVERMNFKEVQSGANVSILSPYDEGVFYGVLEVDGVKIASPVQIYLDLMGFRGRGEEAARVLFKQTIKPKW
jgi:hypothetical protein